MIKTKQMLEYQKEMYILNKTSTEDLLKRPWWNRGQHVYRKPLPPLDQNFRRIK